jgi:hypothetical protein
MEDWNILCLVHKHMEDWNILNLFGLVMVQLLWNLNWQEGGLFWEGSYKKGSRLYKDNSFYIIASSSVCGLGDF